VTLGHTGITVCFFIAAANRIVLHGAGATGVRCLFNAFCLLTGNKTCKKNCERNVKNEIFHLKNF
jgi:hypothetical protein